ncbi:pectinesterase inhibitor-like [Papaver somniferum]|uniref:pectinesterase inhibitor-like n=1 Tax=Papaver somniferum TaxID=3469 RepID=UPI000E7009F0|nr:pectinesterase inhibitor-like [Papaver somniferum]
MYSSNAINVGEICSRTKNPSYCRRVLADIPDLTQEYLLHTAFLANNWADANATNIYNQITDMLRKATSAQKGHLEHCHRLYFSCLHDIFASSNALGSRDFFGFKKQATAFANYAKLCEESFGSPPSTPSLLTKQNREFIDLVDIVLAITDHLTEGQ